MMKDAELRWETWAEKRERWSCVRFISTDQVMNIASLFGTVEKIVLERDTFGESMRLTVTVNRLGRTREVVINGGDAVRHNGTEYVVVPEAELMERMEPVFDE